MQTIVAEPSLRNYDQVNDRKYGKIIESATAEKVPGSSGHQVKIRVDLLLEGFRPGRIVRVFGPGWRIQTLPQEENLWARPRLARGRRFCVASKMIRDIPINQMCERCKPLF